MKLFKFFAVGFAALAMAACSTISDIGNSITGAYSDAETVQQKFFAAQSQYNVVLGLAVDYAEQPGADPEISLKLAQINDKAVGYIHDAQLILMCLPTEDGGWDVVGLSSTAFCIAIDASEGKLDSTVGQLAGSISGMSQLLGNE